MLFLNQIDRKKNPSVLAMEECGGALPPAETDPRCAVDRGGCGCGVFCDLLIYSRARRGPRTEQTPCAWCCSMSRLGMLRSMWFESTAGILSPEWVRGVKVLFILGSRGPVAL